MNNGHTWKEAVGDNGERIIVDANGCDILSHPRTFCIALSAPELLGALESVTGELSEVFAYGMAAINPERFAAALFSARAAIRKAKGE